MNHEWAYHRVFNGKIRENIHQLYGGLIGKSSIQWICGLSMMCSFPKKSTRLKGSFIWECVLSLGGSGSKSKEHGEFLRT